MTTTSTPSTASSTPETHEDVGIVVGRFQTPRLHEGHKELISRVANNHKQVLIFLGVSPNKRSRRNPLDYEARRLMVQQDFPKAAILPLLDTRDDAEWSKNLDSKIKEILSFSTVRLYGGRDSFIAHYLGTFPTTEIEPHIFTSATSLRDKAGHDAKASAEWRAGVIYGAYNQYPKMWPTVDIAPIRFNEDNSTEVLLARKPGEKQWRFIGGFCDTTDESYEQAAKREVREEANIEVSDFEYVCSRRINDWRYRDDVDKIMTTFFLATYLHGVPQPQDDIEEVGWFTFGAGPRSFHHVQIVPAHAELQNELAIISQDRGWSNAPSTSDKSIEVDG